MFTTITTRLFSGALVLAIVSIIAFTLAALSPRHPEIYKLGADAPIEAVQSVRTSLGLDLPVPQQYLNWALDAVRGDLGTSYVSDTPVSDEIKQRAPRTLILVFVSVLVAALLGVTIGVLAAVYQGTWIDRLLTTSASMVQATPGFWLGILLVTLFSVMLGWLPATGYVPPTVSFSGWIQSLILPAFALGLPSTAAIVRQLRGAMVGELKQDYVRSAIAQGYGRMQVALGQALRNAMGPAATVIGFQTIVKLSTVVVIEKVFAIDGLGSLALNAVFRGDTPVLLGTVMTFAIVVVIVNMLVDLSYSWISPKSRGAA